MTHTHTPSFEYKGKKFRLNKIKKRVEVAYTTVKNDEIVIAWRKHCMSNGYKLNDIAEVNRLMRLFP